MITQAISNLFHEMLVFFLNLLPTGGLPEVISDCVGFVVDVANLFSGFFPIGSAFAIVSAVFAFEIAVFTVRGIKFVIGFIRGAKL